MKWKPLLLASVAVVITVVLSLTVVGRGQATVIPECGAGAGPECGQACNEYCSNGSCCDMSFYYWLDPG